MPDSYTIFPQIAWLITMWSAFNHKKGRNSSKLTSWAFYSTRVIAPTPFRHLEYVEKVWYLLVVFQGESSRYGVVSWRFFSVASAALSYPRVTLRSKWTGRWVLVILLTSKRLERYLWILAWERENDNEPIFLWFCVGCRCVDGERRIGRGTGCSEGIRRLVAYRESRYHKISSHANKRLGSNIHRNQDLKRKSFIPQHQPGKTYSNCRRIPVR